MKNKSLTIEHAHIESDDGNGQLDIIIRCVKIKLLQQITHDVCFHRSDFALALDHFAR